LDARITTLCKWICSLSSFQKFRSII